MGYMLRCATGLWRDWNKSIQRNLRFEKHHHLTSVSNAQTLNLSNHDMMEQKIMWSCYFSSGWGVWRRKVQSPSQDSPALVPIFYGAQIQASYRRILCLNSTTLPRLTLILHPERIRLINLSWRTRTQLLSSNRNIGNANPTLMKRCAKVWAQETEWSRDI